MTIENQMESLKGLSKPLRNDGYDEIAKRVNEKLAALGYDRLLHWRSIKIFSSEVVLRSVIS